MGINKPFTEYFRYINCQYAVYARNYIWYGYLKTKFGLVSTPYPVYSSHFNYYFHHPPLISLWISLFFRVFGVNETSVRLAEIMLSLLSLIIIYNISKILWGKNVAYMNSFIYALLPITVYYDRIAAPDYSAIPFILLTLYFYILWSWSSNSKYLWYLSISLFVGTWFDWQAYFIVFGLSFHTLVLDNKLRAEKFRVIVFLVMVSVVSFASYILFVLLVGGYSQIVTLYHGFLTRAGLRIYSQFDRPGLHYSFSFLQFLILELKRSLNLFTSMIFLLVIWWWVHYLFNRCKNDDYIIPLFIHGILSIFIFKQGAWIHDFWIYQLVPAIVLSSGRGLLLLTDFISNHEYMFELPTFVDGFIVFFVSLVELVFVVEFFHISHNPVNSLELSLILFACFFFTFMIWIFIARVIIRNGPINDETLKLSAFVLVPLFLLLTYLKNLFYPYLPKYGILLLFSIIILMVLAIFNILKLVPIKLIKMSVILIILTLFIVQSVYLLHVRNSWNYPWEYTWGLRINHMTTPSEGVLVTKDLSALASYSSTFYSERRVTIVWNFSDFMTKFKTGGYNYLITDEKAFSDPKYSRLVAYLLLHYTSSYFDGLYIFNLSSPSKIIFEINNISADVVSLKYISLYAVLIRGKTPSIALVVYIKDTQLTHCSVVFQNLNYNVTYSCLLSLYHNQSQKICLVKNVKHGYYNVYIILNGKHVSLRHVHI